MKLTTILFGLLSIVLISCSSESTGKGSDSDWEIDPILQLFENPIVQLSIIDTQLLVITGGTTSFLNDYPDSSREGITLGHDCLVDHWHKPINSNSYIYCYSTNDQEISLSGYQSGERSFLARGTLDFHSADTTISEDYSVYSPYPHHKPFGAVSEDDYLLTGIDNGPRSLNYCGDSDLLIITQVTTDTSGGLNSTSPAFKYIRSIPFNIRQTNSIKYYSPYFYISTDNGILQMSKDGSNTKWLLRLQTECSVTFKSLLQNQESLTDSLRNLWYNSNQRKILNDVIVSGDSIFALQNNGNLLVSGDRGESWLDTFKTNINEHIELIKTKDFFGAVYGSQLFQLRFDIGDIAEVNTKDISSLLINDIQEYKGRLYIATDGGLYSKKISEVE